MAAPDSLCSPARIATRGSDGAKNTGPNPVLGGGRPAGLWAALGDVPRRSHAASAGRATVANPTTPHHFAPGGLRLIVPSSLGDLCRNGGWTCRVRK
jgi:hypothetical protein